MLKVMGSKIRVVLTGTLVALLVLTAITGGAALLALEQLRTSEAKLRAHSVDRAAWLEQIRGGIYLSGTLARDYFVEPKGEGAPALMGRLAELEKETRQAVARYAGEASPGDPGAMQLRGEVTAYWRVLNLMVEIAGKRRSEGLDA